MTALTLYHSVTSPYVRKVMVLAHECGIMDQIALVTGSGTPIEQGKAPLSVNPLGKVPVLARPDGSALYDSRVICAYLDARASGGLYPDGPRRWDTMTLEATADGIMDAALLMVYEGRLRPEDMRFAPFVEGQRNKITRSLDVIEGRWMAYLAGRLCAGQIALACALEYLDLRHVAPDWRVPRPALAAWLTQVSARDSMRATAPPAG